MTSALAARCGFVPCGLNEQLLGGGSKGGAKAGKTRAYDVGAAEDFKRGSMTEVQVGDGEDKGKVLLVRLKGGEFRAVAPRCTCVAARARAGRWCWR